MKHPFAIAMLLLAFAAVSAPARAQDQNPNDYYSQPRNWHGVLTADDQRRFDDEYAKWMNSQRKNDRDDIAEHARNMQEIMTRANIPAGVPFDQIASNPGPGGPAYPNGAYANGAYPPAGYAQVRLSGDDQRKFDEAYSKWMDSQRKNDQDDVTKNAGKMQQIMSRNGIPSDVPFSAIASGGYPSGSPYQGAYAQVAPQRLSSKDQSEFDKSYKHWVDARHKKDMDDVDKNARKMQEIMARYNIPADVPFDRIATVGAYH